MPREHDWTYGECRRCGYSTDLAGGTIEDAPPCVPYDADTAERLVDAIGEALGVDTAGNCVEDGSFQRAIEAAQRILDEAS